MRLLLIDPSAWNYNVESVYQQPLGGSQSALCYLGEAMARRGHQVTLLTNTTQPGLCRGVCCLAISTTTPEILQSHNPDACVVLNAVVPPSQLRSLVGPSSLLILWITQASDVEAARQAANPSVSDGYDFFVFVSNWQRSQYLSTFPMKPEKAIVLRNAIAPVFEGMFPPGTSICHEKKKPPVLAYTSTPYRGLDVLLKVFPEVRKAVPGTRLKVFSSMKVYQVPEDADSREFGALYRACRETEGVEYCGSVAQHQLAGELKQVTALAYANTFPETSCIAVMEAMAAGCGIITSDLGALPETTAGFGTLVSLADGIDAYYPRFQQAVITFLRAHLNESDLGLEDRLRRQVDFANTDYTWTQRAAEWEAWLADCIRQPAKISELLTMAIQHHQVGRLHDAEQIYRQILQADPNQADALHLLGLIAHQVGKHGIAIEYIERAIGLNGNVANYHFHLGEAYCSLHMILEAVACYRRALELKPDFAEAHNNLGTTWKDLGKLDEAVVCYYRALELSPECAEFHNNLGIALREQEKLDEAVACFYRAIKLNPDYAAAHRNLGNVLKHLGKADEAVPCSREAQEPTPGIAIDYNCLGNELKDQGKVDEAVACYRQALKTNPDFAEALNNLGNLLRVQGKLDEALACFHRALELKPECAEVHNNLGIALQVQEKLDEAVACYRRALMLKPDYAAAHCNLGIALQVQEKLDEAVLCYRQALERMPECAELHSNLGYALQVQGKLDEAEASFREALKTKPDEAGTHNNLGIVLKDQGKLDEAMACFVRVLDLRPDDAGIHSNLLFTLHYLTGGTPVGLAEAHAEYDRRHAAPLYAAAAQHGCLPDRSDRLRLGFVSPDLGRHPVGYFLVAILEQLGQANLETICYSDRSVKDDLSQRLQAAATHWRDVLGTSDERLAEQIRADRIDILFDLAGHTAHNRLLLFARKPAPIQVTWAGYVGTTGLRAMDYLLADCYEVPPGAERHYREQVLRMPDGYVCYAPPADAPAVNRLPALDRGQVTLGCFNNPAKVTRQAIEIWATILRRLPGSRLVLKYKGWNDRGNTRRFAEMFGTHGIDPGRLEFLGFSPHAELLAEYNRIDLALDPFPYSGGLTTCEALWMGVPVITCPFDTFASRHSLSHLSNVGVPELIAHDLGEYVELTVSLASDLPRLAALRAGLRERMAASPLCDGKRFAANLAALLRDVWRHWVEQVQH